VRIFLRKDDLKQAGFKELVYDEKPQSIRKQPLVNPASANNNKQNKQDND
jgi:hypothetical protein